MLTQTEIIHALLLPVIVSAALAGLGFWRKWAWMMPLAAGAGFVVNYVADGMPRLPPRDGSDWLVWLAMICTVAGVTDGRLRSRWGVLIGVLAGVAVLLVVRPLVPRNIEPGVLLGSTVSATIYGIVMLLIVDTVEKWIGPWAVLGALCMVLGGAGVVVMSSNFRTLGVHGLAASAALGPVAVLGYRFYGTRAVAIVAFPVLAGLIAGGQFYPSPGVETTHAVVLLLAPSLLLLGLFVPFKRRWKSALVALLAVTVAVVAVTAPTALKAKKAVEEDPYAAYK